MRHQGCPVCTLPTPRGALCNDCLPVSHLDGVTAFYQYEERKVVAELIKALKYSRATETIAALRGLLNTAEKDFVPHVAVHEFIVIPVPLHPRRFNERGFNQAELLSRLLLETHADTLPAATVVVGDLARVRYTNPQAEQSGTVRRTNVKDAFAWLGAGKAPSHVLLVDDVFTTGSTMQECARVLKHHGAEWVWGVAVARG